MTAALPTPINSGDPLIIAYRTDSCRLTAHRAPLAAVVLLVASVVGSGIDAFYYPQRTATLAIGLAVYVLVAAALVVLVRRCPAWSLWATQGFLSYAVVEMSIYCAVVHSRTEVLLITLALLMTGAATFFPWGVRGQLGISVSALAGYALALALGATATLPLAYEVFGLVTAACVAALGAFVIDQNRFSAFEAQEEARQANRFKSEFVATVSHELRTPLSVIVGYTELLLDDAHATLKDEQRDMLQRVRQQSVQVLDLIQAMFDLNRLETRQLQLSIDSFSVGDMVAGLRTNLPASWAREGVAVQWDVRDEHTVLRSDRAKVEMVLRNLIHNALKYTDAGRVIISAEPRRSDACIVFRVRDTGSGIAPEEQSAIFEMFRQGSAPPRGGGVGLGLYIVKQLTEALGGEVRLESRDGEGTEVMVSLPMDVERATPENPSRSEVTAGRQPPKRGR